MEIKFFELIEPTEDNGYCVFSHHLEDDKNVFFHMTPAEKRKPIMENGFQSARELEVGDLESVSYAKRSSNCFANLGCNLESEHVVFAVRYADDALAEVVINSSDIHVYKKHLQPEILGVVSLPAGFGLS